MWEEVHVVTVAGRDELKTPEPEHRACREQAWPICHLGNKRERKTKVMQCTPYMARQLSVSKPHGLAPTSNRCCVSLILDG